MATSIPLSRSKVALVDDSDAERIARHHWYLVTRGDDLWYAETTIVRCHMTPRYVKVMMHRYVLAAPAGFHIDHVNRDGLDNRRINLRPATPSQNQMNSRARIHTSQFKGVYWHKQHSGKGAWAVRIIPPGERPKRIGCFRDEIEAAHAYDRAARQHYGKFARTNFPEGAES